MIFKNAVYYEARVAFGLTALLLVLLLPGAVLLGYVSMWEGRIPPLFVVLKVFEYIVPLAAGFLAARLMSVEREEGFDELRRSYRESTWIWVTRRVVMALGALLLTTVLTAAACGFTFNEIVLPVLPPMLYLFGLSLLLNNLTANALVTSGIISAYWLAESLSVGQYSRELFLFRASVPLETIPYHLNRQLLAGFGLLFLALNLAYAVWRRRYGR